MRPEWTHLDEVLTEGVRWMQDDQQPDGALLTHLGIGTHAGGGLSVAFCPNGYLGERKTNGAEHRDAVVIFELGASVDTSELSATEARDYKADPFTQDEVDELEVALSDAGADTYNHWNGAGFTSVSFQLKAGSVSPSLNRAVAKYLAHCPDHESVFCGERAKWGDPDRDDDVTRCTWFSASRARLVEPNFPDVPLPSPATHEATRHEDGLERVLRAIADAVPVLVDLGVHPAQVVPGLRGEGVEDPTLHFAETGGYGVTLPPELYAHLVELVRSASALGAI